MNFDIRTAASDHLFVVCHRGVTGGNIPCNTMPAYQIALLYKYRWHVELFFKWIKQHLEIKSFWGTTEGAVRIQIFTAIIAYCMVAIVEHDLHLNRSTYEVLRVLSASLLDKTPVRDIFFKETNMDENDSQLKLNFF